MTTQTENQVEQLFPLEQAYVLVAVRIEWFGAGFY
jgi:hypothetical protein